MQPSATIEVLSKKKKKERNTSIAFSEKISINQEILLKIN